MLVVLRVCEPLARGHKKAAPFSQSSRQSKDQDCVRFKTCMAVKLLQAFPFAALRAKSMSLKVAERVGRGI